MRYKILLLLLVLLLITAPLYAVNDGTDEIFPSGNVGIGTTSPKDELHLVGDFIQAEANPWHSFEDTDTNTGYFHHLEVGDTYPFALFYATFSSNAPSVSGSYPVWYVDSSQNFKLPDPTKTMLVGGNLTINGTFVVDGNTVNLSDTTDEYILAFDVATQTWRGVTATAGSGDLKADGTVPLTADWNAGNSLYDITAMEFKGALIGQADTVATITGLAPDTATTQATQGNITSLGTLTSLAVTGTITSGTATSVAGAITLYDKGILTFNDDGGGNSVTLNCNDSEDVATLTGGLDVTGVITSTSPVFTTPALGTPSALVGTNISGTGASFTAGTATVATTVTITDNEATAENNPIVFVAGADPDGGNLGLETDGTTYYTPSTGTITATEFVGGGVGITGIPASSLAATLAIGADANDLDITSMNKLEGVDAQVYIDLGTDGIVEIEADTAVTINTELRLENISGNTFWVGPNCTYTTITLAEAAAVAGDSILVAEGTYTETVTYSVDNLTIKAIGSKENTTITQAAATVVNFGVMSSCVLEGFTVSITAATANSHNTIISSNDAAVGTGANIIRNCDIIWIDDGTVLANPECVYLVNGDHEFWNCSFTFNNVYSGTDAQNRRGVYTDNDNNQSFYHCKFDWDNAATGTSQSWVVYGGGSATIDFWDCEFDIDTTVATSGLCYGIKQIATNTLNIHGGYINAEGSSTGVLRAVANTNGTVNVYNTHIYANNSDGDADAVNEESGTINLHNITVSGDGVISGTPILYGFVNPDGRVISPEGFVIAQTYDSTYHFDTSTQGADAGTVYIGNDTIAFSFTGKHFYQLGDTDLITGELVSLIGDRIYRTTDAQDKQAIGIYWGITNVKDSMGNVLVVDKVVEEDVWNVKDKKLEKKDIIKVNEYGKVGNPKLTAITNDFAHAVAILGDSIEEHDTFPLAGARVTVDAGTIVNGDYLCSSDRDGYLEKQSDDIRHSYTKAIAREDINSDKKDAYIYLLQ